MEKDFPPGSFHCRCAVAPACLKASLAYNWIFGFDFDLPVTLHQEPFSLNGLVFASYFSVIAGMGIAIAKRAGWHIEPAYRRQSLIHL